MKDDVLRFTRIQMEPFESFEGEFRGNLGLRLLEVKLGYFFSSAIACISHVRFHGQRVPGAQPAA